MRVSSGEGTHLPFRESALGYATRRRDRALGHLRVCASYYTEQERLKLDSNHFGRVAHEQLSGLVHGMPSNEGRVALIMERIVAWRWIVVAMR